MGTLIELLETLALYHQQRAVSADEDGLSKWMHADLANASREAAARLRSEMERAELLRGMTVNDVKQDNVANVLARINGGPLK